MKLNDTLTAGHHAVVSTRSLLRREDMQVMRGCILQDLRCSHSYRGGRRELKNQSRMQIKPALTDERYVCYQIDQSGTKGGGCG